MITFIHPLHGDCILLSNTSFKPSTNPLAINYQIRNEFGIQASSIEDAGLTNQLSLEDLIEYGYLSDSLPKLVGMVHLPGVNDELFAKWSKENNVKSSNSNLTLSKRTNAEGLRYVSPEVGYVDRDEEYY